MKKAINEFSSSVAKGMADLTLMITAGGYVISIFEGTESKYETIMKGAVLLIVFVFFTGMSIYYKRKAEHHGNIKRNLRPFHSYDHKHRSNYGIVCSKRLH